MIVSKARPGDYHVIVGVITIKIRTGRNKCIVKDLGCCLQVQVV